MSALLAALYDDHVRIRRAQTDAALAAHNFDSLAIFAGRAPSLFLDDQSYPFKANPHFKLWAPLADCADCWLVYRPNAPMQLIFLQPIDYWHKPPALPADYWTKHFAIEVIREPRETSSLLHGLKHCAFIGELQPEFAALDFAINPAALLEHLHFHRASKTAYELECMRRASARGARGHLAAASAFRAGGSEYEIHQAYVRATGHVEHELPYANIVALNEHAAVLHYQHQQREVPATKHSFLIDAGAEFAGYACDITRTYSHVVDDFSQLIAHMDRVQQRLCDQVRPGIDYANIHLSAHELIGGVLKDFGIIKLDAPAAVESGLTAVFFPHGVGHLLGLQVHDVSGFALDTSGRQKPRPEGHPYLRLTRTLEPGFVVTIEPGLYFIDALLREARASKHSSHIDWTRVEAFKRYGGIRIEDDVVCTDEQPENLTRGAFAAVGAAAN